MSNPSSAVELARLCLQDECSVSSEEFDMSDPTWISAERHAALSDLNNPSSTERMHSPQNAHKDED
ncbi:putative nucleolar protein 4-like, partial [Triplophysa rosa]